MKRDLPFRLALLVVWQIGDEVGRIFESNELLSAGQRYRLIKRRGPRQWNAQQKSWVLRQQSLFLAACHLFLVLYQRIRGAEQSSTMGPDHVGTLVVVCERFGLT